MRSYSEVLVNIVVLYFGCPFVNYNFSDLKLIISLIFFSFHLHNSCAGVADLSHMYVESR